MSAEKKNALLEWWKEMFMEKYNPKEIEQKWQTRWAEEAVYKTEADPSRKKYYVLEMFPYPSGNLHMGHVRNYSIGDVLARYKRMAGFNVIHPMGFDAFGMPAENAAIQHGTHPAKWTFANIENMTRQQKELGLSYDSVCAIFAENFHRAGGLPGGAAEKIFPLEAGR